MTDIEHYELPFLNSAAPLAAHLTRAPWGAWLDSGRPETVGGRYDILVARPSALLIGRGGVSEWHEEGTVRRLDADPLDVLQAQLRRRRVPTQRLPFCGGAIGYFSYDLGQRLEGVPERRAETALPELAVGFYDWAVVTDHVERRTFWVGRPQSRDTVAEVGALIDAAAERTTFSVAGAPRETPSYEGYAAAFQRVQDYLRHGDCYQVNLARRIASGFEGDPWAAYLRLRASGGAPFGVFMRTPFASLLSLSPERFLRLDGRQVTAQPIKGTRPRRDDPQADRAEADALSASLKDRAENVMIVDLLRNDLGKHCVPGSVHVPQLCAVESFPTVHHLVSTVVGELLPGRDAVDLLRGALPAGSITGAPKHRVVEIIHELEPLPRGVYCGAIGYISDDGGMDTNVAIRTAVCAGGEISYWAGGGVVVDSTLEGEYEETLHKARAFLGLLVR